MVWRMDMRTFGILLFAAVLEVGGDTIVREGLLRWNTGWNTSAALILIAGVLVLGAYGIYLNTSPIAKDLDTLFGVYVVFFAFVGAVAGSLRHWRFDLWTLGGVLLIVAGGLLVYHGATLRNAPTNN